MERAAARALVRALSRVVLSRETILVHAESVLERADLIEGSLHSSAFNLWFAVLQRAEAEAAVERLVASVLEDNPGAHALRQALAAWQLARSSADEAEPLSEPAPSSAIPALSRAHGEQVRWLLLAAVAIAFAALFLLRARPQPAPPAGEAPTARAAPIHPAAPVQVGGALRARPPALAQPVDAGSESEAPAVQRGALDTVQKATVQKRGR